MRKIFLILAAMSMPVLAASQLANAQNVTQESKKVTETPQAVNIGNKICPVTGEKINEKTKATYEYQGKVYNFCCPMCIDAFKKDPKKYIKKVEDELKAAQEQKKK